MTAKRPTDALKRWYDQLGAMIDQVGHPDYSLREMVDGMRQIRDEMIAAAPPTKATVDGEAIFRTVADKFKEYPLAVQAVQECRDRLLDAAVASQPSSDARAVVLLRDARNELFYFNRELFLIKQIDHYLDNDAATLPQEGRDEQSGVGAVADVAKAIDESPLIASLLYDLNLLPEQIKDARRYNYMLAVIDHMRQALKPPPQSDKKGVATMIPMNGPGEKLIGYYAGPDGKTTAAILLQGEGSSLTWTQALQWAKDHGGDLPNRVEALLLFQHHRGEFQREVYWTNEQPADACSYAWYQSFDYGYQDNWHQDNEFMARAVRRVAI